MSKRCLTIAETLLFHSAGSIPPYPEFVSIDYTTGNQTFNIPSNGKATHLGKSTWFSVSQVHNTFIEEAPWDQTGTSIFTSADGSTLVGTFVGTTGPQGDSPFVGAGTYVIESGTGRFVGASGNGTYSYVVAPDFSSAHLVFTGTITKP
ncbi:MAG: hypothetical protein IPN33_22360 [Saprospiraceae bacterium]|nr:hypothetical protein [Saprospiraceae bacterium]